MKVDRCPSSNLTRGEVHVLAAICSGYRPTVQHGIYRALVIRGLLTPGVYELTDAGRAALRKCRFLTPALREALLQTEADNRKIR